ncbi:MAG: hypothetical protein OEZ06_30835 [Myxococcales bacterium]|nr:hypothetical protein [Myxococcales bacterium]
MLDGLCDSAFDGVLEPGDACTSSIECARPERGSVTCDDRNGSGVCAREPEASEGEPCFWACKTEGSVTSCLGVGSMGDGSFEFPQCHFADGLYCGPDDRCQPLSVAGETCEGDHACVEGSHCNFASGSCVEALGEGEACTTGGCDADLFCKDGSCAPLVANGEPCDASDRCAEGRICEGGVCGGGFAALEIGLLCSFGAN